VLLIVLFLAVSACGPGGDRSEGELEDGQTVGSDNDQPRDERRARPVQQGDLADQIEDARLASRVLIALADDDQLRRFPFDVDAIRGEVFVRGDEPTLNLYRRVENVASGVSGVRSVVNETVSDEVSPARTTPEPGIAELPEIEVGSPEDVVAEPAPVREPVARESAPTPEPAEVLHTVRSGESLWTIARQHNTSIAEIRRLNNMSSDNLRPGQRIRVR
jgi:LysM repeat protein